MRRISENHPAASLLHTGNASLIQQKNTWVKVAGGEYAANMERGTLLKHGVRRREKLGSRARQGGDSGTRRTP
jgi:hypothetical protein